MGKVRRGEIWEIRRFGTDAVSTELGATKPEEPRRCLVVSSDRYNEIGNRVTVAPLRSFDSPSWSADTDFVRWGKLLEWSRKAQWWGVILCNDWLEHRARGLTKLVFADCGQLRSFPAEGFMDNSYCGRIDDIALHQVEATVHALMNSETRRHKAPTRYRQGDVLEAHFTGSHADYAVVLSCDDYASDNLYDHRIIVPLVDLRDFGNDNPDPGLFVEVKAHWKKQEAERRFVAVCQEVKRIAHGGREVRKLGWASNLTDIRAAVERYLEVLALARI